MAEQVALLSDAALMEGEALEIDTIELMEGVLKRDDLRASVKFRESLPKVLEMEKGKRIREEAIEWIEDLQMINLKLKSAIK